MENNFDNTPDGFQDGAGTPDNAWSSDSALFPGQEQSESEAQSENEEPMGANQRQEQPVYTDPNAGYRQTESTGNPYRYYQQPNPNQPQQDNYSYNTGNQTGYNRPYYPPADESPMSTSDWLLTILVSMIPCAGLIMYFVWAFSKTENVNRRNFCRANLIIQGISLVLGIICLSVVAFLILGAAGSANSVNPSFYY